MSRREDSEMCASFTTSGVLCAFQALFPTDRHSHDGLVNSSLSLQHSSTTPLHIHLCQDARTARSETVGFRSAIQADSISLSKYRPSCSVKAMRSWQCLWTQVSFKSCSTLTTIRIETLLSCHQVGWRKLIRLLMSAGLSIFHVIEKSA